MSPDSQTSQDLQSESNPSFGGTKLENGFEKSKHSSKLKLFV